MSFACVPVQQPIHQSPRRNRTKGDERAHGGNHRQSNPIRERLGHEPNSYVGKLERNYKNGTAGISGETVLIVIDLTDTRKEFIPTGQKQLLRQNGTSEVLS